METKTEMILALCLGIGMILRSAGMLYQGTNDLVWYISGLVGGSGLGVLATISLISRKKT